MKKFWKWFFILLGAFLFAGIVFTAAMFFLRGGAEIGPRGSFVQGVRPGMGAFRGRMTDGFGMMGGFGMLGMLFRGLIPLGVLVLAGFGVAYLVKNSKKSTPPPPMAAASISPVMPPVCDHCGKSLDAEWKVCPYCGSPVQHPESEAQQK
jgi:hypothetical protein